MMKNAYLIILLFIALFFSSSCKKDIAKSEWELYCEETALGGEIELNIDGKSWGTGCVHAIYSETISADLSYNLLYLYAYNYGSTFYINSDVEVFFAVYSESTSNGQTETSTEALFLDGFIANAQNSGNFEGKSFSSDESTTDEINITQLTVDKAKGTLSFKLFNEEDSSEEITITGSFEANIEQ